MSNKKKSKGRLQQYLGWPILFAAAIAVVNVILFLWIRLPALLCCR